MEKEEAKSLRGERNFLLFLWCLEQVLESHKTFEDALANTVQTLRRVYPLGCIEPNGDTWYGFAQSRRAVEERPRDEVLERFSLLVEQGIGEDDETALQPMDD